MPGIPVGPGTVFYLLAALAVPLVGRGGPGAARQVGVAVGMVCTGALSFWLFERVGQMVDGRPGVAGGRARDRSAEAPGPPRRSGRT